LRLAMHHSLTVQFSSDSPTGIYLAFNNVIITDSLKLLYFRRLINQTKL
jgi:hypothetical protein